MFRNNNPKIGSGITAPEIGIGRYSSQDVFFLVEAEDIFVAIKLIEKQFQLSELHWRH